DGRPGLPDRAPTVDLVVPDEVLGHVVEGEPVRREGRPEPLGDLPFPLLEDPRRLTPVLSLDRLPELLAVPVVLDLVGPAPAEDRPHPATAVPSASAWRDRRG